MPHLAVVRRGWQNEHLAAFILSKFAFVANPSKIGDDIGTDFFCTFFDTIDQGKKEYLVPKNSFAIQIKSNSHKTSINVTKQIDYLLRLELPFFIGITDQKNSKLDIYSGEYLPILFCFKGVPESLNLVLKTEHDFGINSYFEELSKNSFKLMCPLVASFSPNLTDESIKKRSTLLKAIASRVQRNISAKVSEEYIFSVGENGQIPLIMAGPGSNKVFRENFKKRLAEALFNLSWIHSQPNHHLNMDEYNFYLNIYREMQKVDPFLPEYLTKIFKKLVEQVEIANI